MLMLEFTMILLLLIFRCSCRISSLEVALMQYIKVQFLRCPCVLSTAVCVLTVYPWLWFKASAA